MNRSVEEMKNALVVLKARIEDAEAKGADSTAEVHDEEAGDLPAIPLDQAKGLVLNLESRLAVEAD